jgi:FkbM family methyltransferase
MIDLAKILKDHHRPAPHVIWEVGANHPNQVHVAPLIATAKRVELFEPHPYFAQELRRAFGSDPKIQIHQIALAEQEGQALFRDDGCSSYLDGVASPRTKRGEPPPNTFSVTCKRVEQYDPGNIDLLAIDTEGAEWHVIGSMISRPVLICVEMGLGADPAAGRLEYVNPHAEEIRQWMAWQGYRMVESDGQDEVYVR